ncbi:adenosylmethionine--8-amino-7-oxononanoate aminotransferase BioA, partial [Streptomyces tricolor]
MPELDVPQLLELDRRHVWHPYGPMPGRAQPLVVAGGQLGRGEVVDVVDGAHAAPDGVGADAVLG